MLNRRIRALAIPTAAILLLAACGTNETNQEEPATNIPATEAEVEVEDKSDAWPIVEDEDGNIVENPEDEPVEDEAMPAEDPVSTDASGNVTAVEFGDGEILEFDMDAAVGDVAMSPGTRVYGLSENGGDFVIATEVNPVAELEEYRERAGGEPVTYMSVDVDNREGTENINMYQVAVYDAAGNEYLFEGADKAVDIWQSNLDEAGDDEGYRDGTELYNSYINQGAPPHQRSTMILVGDELPDEFTAVTAMPRGVFEVTPTTPLKN